MFLEDKKKKLAGSDCGSGYNMEKQWPDEFPRTTESTDSSSNIISSKKTRGKRKKSFEWEFSDKKISAFKHRRLV